MCAKLLKLWHITKQLYKISAFINLIFIRVRFITKEHQGRIPVSYRSLFLRYFVGDSRLLFEPLYIYAAPTTNINLITASA